MSEIDYWKSMFLASFMAAFFSLFDSMDFEIYWPLLVFYFCGMTLFLCRVKIEHMIKYKYVPWDSGRKKKYGKPKQDASFDV